MMFSKSDRLFHCVLFLCVYTTSVISQETSITIPLNGTITFDNRELYSGFKNLSASSTLQIKFSDVGSSLTFIVLQAHVHLSNITLYQNVLMKNSSTVGANVGAVVFKPMLDSYYILNSNENNVTVFIAVHGYLKSDPIPGACNLVYPPISPTIRATTNKDYINVDAADAANALDPSCVKPQHAYVDFYMMYLPEMNFGIEEYFDGIQKMMTYANVLENGIKIPQTIDSKSLRRVLSTYPGAGRIFVAIALPYPSSSLNLDVPTGYAVYVPSHSYGCNVVDDGCEDTDGILSHTLSALLLFVGLFVCFFGHRFFKTEMFLAGFFSCIIVTYIGMSLITTADTTALVSSSATCGLFFGAIWLLFWWLYGIPVVAVLLPTLILGFLFASIFYYRLPANLIYLEMDINFWPLFILVMILTAFALVSVTFAANITCCAILGAYATVYSIDYFIGSNLKYIIVNVIRRAVVDGFNYAVLLPPFQQSEYLLSMTWMVLSALGFVFQHWHNKGRPPFPPPPRNTRPAMPIYRNQPSSPQPVVRNPQSADETSPLLSSPPSYREDMTRA